METLAELEIQIGYANPDCLDSNEDFADENDCEAYAANQDGVNEFYESSGWEE